MNEAERDFLQDVREKKQTASGVHHRASRRKGYRGGVKLTFELIDKETKEKYTKGGEIMSVNVKASPSWRDLCKLSPEGQKTAILEAGRLYGYEQKTIGKAFGVCAITVGRKAKELGISQAMKDLKAELTVQQRADQFKRLSLLLNGQQNEPQTEPESKPEADVGQESRKSVTIFAFDQVMKGEDASKWLMGAALALATEKRMTRVKIHVEMMGG